MIRKNKGIDFSCYSFNGNKLITTGGGGLISMNNVKDYNLAMHLSSQAKKDAIQFIHDDVGFNIRMSNLHASIGMSQILNLKKLKEKTKNSQTIH